MITSNERGFDDESRSAPEQRASGAGMRRLALLCLILATALGVCAPSFAQAPGDNFGYRATPIWGQIPVLTILWQFSDTEPFPSDYRTTYSQLVFGGTATLKPSLAGELGFFDQASNGSFNFANAGIVGPLYARDIPGTALDESKLASADPATYFTTISRAAEAAGFNFRAFDRNGDGTLTRDELVINTIHSARQSHEFIATTHPAWIPPPTPVVGPVFNELGYAFTRLLGYVYRADSSTSPTTTRPLNLWFNGATGDNYSTGTSATIPAGYGLVGALGRMFNPAALAPLNTVAVYIWRNNLRKDYLLTTTSPTGAEATALQAKGYVFIRQDGFIFDPARAQPPGTVALYLWEGQGMIGGGQNRGIDFTLASGLRVRSQSVSIAQDVIHNLSGLAHEMTHYAGGVDVYGAGFAKNFRYSLMGALQAGRRVSHPDPMNKIIAGWVKPTVRTIGTSGTFDILASAISKNEQKAVVFYHPTRGNKEFFLLEYRYKAQLSARTDIEPLYGLWNAATADNWNTTSRIGGALFDARNPAAKYARTDGFIFKASLPRPVGTIPLYSWYNASNGDHFSTTNPVWAGTPFETRGGYVMQAISGYVHDPARPQPPNTLPLYSWFSPSRQDNFMTTDKGWTGTPTVSTRAPDYTCIRLEGYLEQGAYFNYDGAAFTNLHGIPDAGLAIWYVKIGADGIPLIVPARDGSGATLPGEIDRAVYIYPRDRRYGFSQELFKQSDGIVTVNWPDGTPSGLRLEVLTTDLTQPSLRVRAW
ncbi:hypothetical protein F2P45_28185 [Massilia sp. CCM 8733]|uniref:EF-hand domain-containing protein n=1 Tax=Massilia mucilaginosa TaxID=2609282 RepID=A0ABX0P0P5_9BURK|nr:hypothetical protein [Massilia mucilaginosa]NHZ92859.1 hypothetical protein [Massilia mucilaginosa]